MLSKLMRLLKWDDDGAHKERAWPWPAYSHEVERDGYMLGLYNPRAHRSLADGERARVIEAIKERGVDATRLGEYQKRFFQLDEAERDRLRGTEIVRMDISWDLYASIVVSQLHGCTNTDADFPEDFGKQTRQFRELPSDGFVGHLFAVPTYVHSGKSDYLRLNEPATPEGEP